MVHLQYANFSTNTFSPEESLNVAPTRDLEDPVDSPSWIDLHDLNILRLTSALYVEYNFGRAHPRAASACF